jgi:hypothetical protein
VHTWMLFSVIDRTTGVPQRRCFVRIGAVVCINVPIVGQPFYFSYVEDNDKHASTSRVESFTENSGVLDVTTESTVYTFVKEASANVNEDCPIT